MRRSLIKEINIARRKGEAIPHCAAAQPRWFIEWLKKKRGLLYS
jgi:hypothetical protein